MRILHTSDWHLGRPLEGYSRLEEQELFLKELSEICDSERIDLILVSGDIYDTANPPANAEKLFYSSLTKLSKGGKRPIIAIAGNHDSPTRLTASTPLALEQSILLLGWPNSTIPIGDYGNFCIADSGEGYFELHLNGEKAVILTMPYPSEKRLHQLLSHNLDELSMQTSYSQCIGLLFSNLSKKYREDTINLAMGHFYVVGGKESSSERPIQLGGSYAIHPNDLPQNAQYIALGHLHRSQKVLEHAYYSGSPLQLSKGEIGYSKVAICIDVLPNQAPKIKQLTLTQHKPIIQVNATSIQHAIELCQNTTPDCYVYLSIQTDRTLELNELKQLKNSPPQIVEILPEFTNLSAPVQEETNFEQMDIKKQFDEFYKREKGTAPTEELIDLFLSIAFMEDENETNTN